MGISTGGRRLRRLLCSHHEYGGTGIWIEDLTLITPPALFCVGYFQDRILWIICSGQLSDHDPLDLCLLIARITSVIHWCPVYSGWFKELFISVRKVAKEQTCIHMFVRICVTDRRRLRKRKQSLGSDFEMVCLTKFQEWGIMVCLSEYQKLKYKIIANHAKDRAPWVHHMYCAWVCTKANLYWQATWE
jgi:hypothetical protein